MAAIQKTIRLMGSKGSQDGVARFDSGAAYSCIRPELAQTLDTVLSLLEPMEFTTAREGEQLTAQERVSLNFYLDSDPFSDEFMLIPGLSEAVIVGSATLQKWRMKLDFEADEVIIDPRLTKLRLL